MVPQYGPFVSMFEGVNKGSLVLKGDLLKQVGTLRFQTFKR